MREKTDTTNITTIPAFIAAQPPVVQPPLKAMYAILKAALPEAEERISYQMPTFWQGQAIAYFDAGEGYLGFYPTSGPIVQFAPELTRYRHSKGAVHLPLDQPLPAALITKMVQWQLAQVQSGAAKPHRTPKPKVAMPAAIREALIATDLMTAYEARPPYQRNDYLGWITQAKREATQQKRLDQMLEELRAGDVFMKMSWRQR
ncbi:YdeI/OmpD-associated family protein [Lacticaseibacillus suibinensis]|uniref:YdeI/OmpD-associated family protein n=1 Tax=Lacticaseibacillus suibinensis TaxID=2486011 RepID=UPI001941FC90|nr:YdeI/OmpD-associated family protein [Lacticaseibacillus suibinensis]